jgi:hypothetical protein
MRVTELPHVLGARACDRDDAMTLSELADAMCCFPPMSAAWKDFAADCRKRLNVALLAAAAGVEAPPDFADYWLSVASGESEDYDADGARAMIH